MGHANNIITAPVDVQGDLAYLFGVGSGDLGTIITSASINKWAKYKPMYSTNLGVLTEQERYDAKYGLSQPARRDVKNTLAQVWGYSKPTNLFRTHDFLSPTNPNTIGYKSDAVQPVVNPGDFTVNLAYQSSFSFPSVMRSGLGAGNITLHDLYPLKGYYFCVAFSDSVAYNGITRIKTSAVTIEELSVGDTIISLSQDELNYLLSIGCKYYYVCATPTMSTNIRLSGPAQELDFIPLPADTAAYMKGEFLVKNALVDGFLVTGLSSVALPTSAADFNIRVPQALPIECHESNYMVHVKATVTAPSTNNIRLTHIMADAVGTLWGDSIAVNSLAVDVYDSNFANENDVFITYGTSETVYLVFRGAFLNSNGSSGGIFPPDGNKVHSTITFRQNGGILGTATVYAKSVRDFPGGGGGVV